MYAANLWYHGNVLSCKTANPYWTFCARKPLLYGDREINKWVSYYAPTITRPNANCGIVLFCESLIQTCTKPLLKVESTCSATLLLTVNFWLAVTYYSHVVVGHYAMPRSVRPSVPPARLRQLGTQRLGQATRPVRTADPSAHGRRFAAIGGRHIVAPRDKLFAVFCSLATASHLNSWWTVSPATEPLPRHVGFRDWLK